MKRGHEKSVVDAFVCLSGAGDDQRPRRKPWRCEENLLDTWFAQPSSMMYQLSVDEKLALEIYLG
jgi:hypothetical protein